MQNQIESPTGYLSFRKGSIIRCPFQVPQQLHLHSTHYMLTSSEATDEPKPKSIGAFDWKDARRFGVELPPTSSPDPACDSTAFTDRLSVVVNGLGLYPPIPPATTELKNPALPPPPLFAHSSLGITGPLDAARPSLKTERTASSDRSGCPSCDMLLTDILQ